jgi:hypothetical protein
MKTIRKIWHHITEEDMSKIDIVIAHILFWSFATFGFYCILYIISCLYFGNCIV